MSTKNRKTKSRSKLDFETKMRIYQQYHMHKPSILSMTREWNISRSTVKRIIEDEASFTEFPKRKTYENRRSAFCEMEKLLTLWIEDRVQRNLPIAAKQIQIKAANLYNNMKRSSNPSVCPDFKPDDKWFEQYRLRAGKCELKLSGEPISDTVIKGKRFPDELKALIEVGRYLPQQVFNVDRVLLFWKSMPDGTFISKKAQEVASDRVTLVLGCNARGDYKLKPLMIYGTDYPCGVENILHELPVHYRSSTSSWLTMRIFEEWFAEHFIPETKEYCQRSGIPFKILLLLDAAQPNRNRLIGLHPNVNVVYLPVNTSPLLQPLDQGIKSIFKAFYFSNTLSMVAKATQGDTAIMVQDFCDAYTIQMGISNIKQAWDAIPKKFLRLAWKCLCPQFLDAKVVAQDNAFYQGMKRQILLTALKLGFGLKMKDVENLIQWTGRDLTNNDLIVLASLIDVKESNGQIDLTENENNNNNSTDDTVQWTTKQLNGQIDLPENVNNNNSTDDIIECTAQDPTEVDDGRNLLTAYSPKYITTSEDEDEDSTDSEDLIIDCIKVEEPELVEPTRLKAILKDSVDEDKMEISDSDSVIMMSPMTNEDVINSPIDPEESQVICDELSQSFQEKNEDHNKDLLETSVIAEKVELAFDHITYAMEKFESIDSNKERFKAVRSAVNDMLSCYKDMLEEKNQAQSIDTENG